MSFAFSQLLLAAYVPDTHIWLMATLSNKNAMELIPMPPEMIKAHDKAVNKTMDINFNRCILQFDLLNVIGRGNYAKVLLVC